jgi:NTP pyrophosphatase (non-canonical NTP hydrolase)
MQHQEFNAVTNFRRWLDSHNGAERTELSTRIMKVAEEFGETVQAWIGATGQNPRKGVTHTYNDVVNELGDVVFTALVAIESLGCCAACEMNNVMNKMQARIGMADGDQS